MLSFILPLSTYYYASSLSKPFSEASRTEYSIFPLSYIIRCHVLRNFDPYTMLAECYLQCLVVAS